MTPLPNSTIARAPVQNHRELIPGPAGRRLNLQTNWSTVLKPFGNGYRARLHGRTPTTDTAHPEYHLGDEACRDPALCCSMAGKSLGHKNAGPCPIIWI